MSELEAEREPPKRAIAVAIAVAITTGLVMLALLLGDWARRTRSGTLHYGRLERLLEKKPHEDLVAAALEKEGMRSLGVARSEEELTELARRCAGSHSDVILAEGRKWATTRAFRGDTVTYVVYFDRSGTMRSFSVLG